MSNEAFDELMKAKADEINYFEDEIEVVVEPATLELLARLAKEQAALEQEIIADNVALAEKTEKLAKLARVRIPGLMATLGMAEFKLIDGSVISIKEDVKCSITEANKAAAFEWLEKNHYDSIIKTKVSADFGKGELEKAEEAVAALKAAGFSSVIDRSVHHSTLKSFVKERLEDGDNIPIDTFGIFEFKEAEIKFPKKKK